MARRIYLVLRAEFARAFPGQAAARRAPLVVANRRYTFPAHRARRDLAYTDGRRVVLLRRALDLPWQNVVGLLLHELGHLFDARVEEPGAERRADRLALRATGLRVRYDRGDVQTVGPGRATRPAHLHQ